MFNLKQELQQICYINSMDDDWLLHHLDKQLFHGAWSETIQNIYIYKDSNYN